jgi:hypothetical protein
VSEAVFDVDLKGLAQLIEEQGPGRLVCELIRNSLDEDGVTSVDVALTPVPGRPLVVVKVVDNAPGGFQDLSHAYTLFAPSYKKSHVEKAGRFNMGDKLFIAAALSCGEPVTICTTKGEIEFSSAGRKRRHRKTSEGSVVSGVLKATRSDFQDNLLPLVKRLIVPEGVRVAVNGETIPVRTPLHQFRQKLQTEIADDAGVLRRTIRETSIKVYEVLPGETPSVYELGIPMADWDCRWHVDVGQKIPRTFV